MNGLVIGLVLGMFITYSFLQPESVKSLFEKIVEQFKKMCGKK